MYIPVSLKNIDLTQAVLLSILIHGVFFISFDNNFIPKVQQDLEISFNPGIFEESNPKIKDQKVKFDLESKKIEKWPELERYILHQIFELNKNYKKYLEEYNFHKLYKELLKIAQ